MAELDDKTLQNLYKRLQNLDEKVVQASKSTGYLGENLREIGKGLENGGVKTVVKSLDDLKAKATETRNALTSSARGTTKSVGKSIRDLRDEYNNLIRSIDRAQKKALSVGSVGMANSGRTTNTTITSFAQGATTNAKASKDAAKASKQQRKEMEKMAVEASKIAKYMTAAFSIGAIKNFVSQVVKVRGEFEMTEVALKNIIGSEVKSQQVWKKTLSLAVNSPFTAQQLLRSTKQLAAFRIETNKLYDTTKMLSDVAIGLGVDVERLILAYGHTKSSGFLRGMYARQFTTAGVNIYGELADYYTKKEGKTVSFKDVYKRISKKMVTYEDVEKIFEKLTSKGGTFYNMQEILSNTVQGQINKIKDTWQQAMNDIGKSQTGLIRGITDIILQVVKNWREWLAVIEGVTSSIIIFKSLQLGSILLGIGNAASTASKSMNNLATAIKRSTAALAKNPILLIASVVAGVGVAAYSAIKHMRDFNNAIDESNLTLYKSRQELLGYEERVEKNNKIINDYRNGVLEGEDALDKLSKAQSDNESVVSELNIKYPEFAEKINTTKDGVVDLTSEMFAYNEQLRIQIALQNQWKQGNPFNQPFTKDAEQYFSKLEKTVLQAQENIGKFQIKLANKGINISSLPQEMQDLVNLDFSNPEKAIEQYNNLIERLRQQYSGKFQDIYTKVSKESSDLAGLSPSNRQIEIAKRARETEEGIELWNQYGDALTSFASDVSLAGHAYDEFQEEFFGGNKYDEGGNQIEFSKAQTMVRTAGQALLDEIAALPDESKAVWQKWIEEEGSIYGVMLKHHEELESAIKDGTIQANKATRGVLETEGKATNKTRQTVYNEALAIELRYIAAEKKLGEVRAQLAAEEGKKFYNQDKELINQLKQELKNAAAEYNQVFDWFVDSTTESTSPYGNNDDGNKKAKKSINSLVELLKKMNTEYEKLKENAYGAAMSAQVVRDEYKEAFKEIFQTTAKGGHKLDDVLTMINWDTVDTTSKAGVAAGIQQLLDFMDANKLWGQYQRDARKQVEKMLSEMKVEMGLSVEVHKREDFDRKMEELFKDYELSVEMRNLKIPKDVAESLFDFSYIDLGDLMERMAEFYNEQKKNKAGDLLDTKAWEAYRKYADKVDAELYKERKKRAEQYSKFLQNELSERAKLVSEFYNNLALVGSEPAFKDKNGMPTQQAANIAATLKKEFEKAMKDLDWKTFKESNFYIDMMDDIANLPSEYLKIALKKINEVVEKADILSPRALKEALRARADIQRTLASQGSFRDKFKYTWGEYRKYRSQIDVNEPAVQQAMQNLNVKDVTKTSFPKEFKLLREISNIRAEEIVQLQEEVNLLDTQAGKLSRLEELEEKRKNAEKARITAQKTVSADIKDSADAEDLKASALERQAEVQGELRSLQDDMARLVGTTTEGMTKEQIRQHTNDIAATKKLIDDYNDEDRKLSERITRLGQYINIANEAENATEAFNAAFNQLSAEDKETAALFTGGTTSTDITSQRNTKQTQLDTKQKKQQGTSQALKSFEEFKKIWQEWEGIVNGVKDTVKNMGNSMYDMLEATGAETNLVTEAWRSFSDVLQDTITRALNMIPTLITGFTSAGIAINSAMGIVGLIAEAIQLVITLITALAKLEDSYHLQAIEDSKKRVDELSKSFDKLNDVIEKTMSSAEYFTEYVAEVENLNQQLEEANLQLQEAAQIKDKSDREEATKNAKDNIDEIQKQLEDAANDLQDTFGGIARKDFRSWAEEFVNAWTDAFLETGDGYDALMDTFEDKMLETFKKQALMRGLAKIMEPLENVINSAVGDDSIIDDAELENIRRQMEIAARNGDEYLRKMAEIYDLGATGELSGLSAGISGMTEETAEVLEGYWNSVRMYTAETNQNVAIIADAFSNPDSTNPMLGQLRLIAEQATQIRTLLDSVTKSAGHSRGGAGIKVFMS